MYIGYILIVLFKEGPQEWDVQGDSSFLLWQIFEYEFKTQIYKFHGFMIY